MATRMNIAKWLEKYQRWQIKVRKNGERRTFTNPTPGPKGQRECHKMADAWLQDNISYGNMRINRLWELFLEDTQARTGTGNYVNIESIGRIWILPGVGNLKIAAVTEQDFQKILNKAARKKKSRKYIKNIRGVVTAFLRFARKSKATNMYASDLQIPHSAQDGDRKVLQPNHLKILFSSSRTTYHNRPCDDWFIHAYRFLAVVGLRPGELCELERRKQTTKGSVTVHGSYNRFLEHTRGKNKNALRTFTLPDLAQRVLSDQAAMLKASGIVSRHLFPDFDGSQASGEKIYKRWQQYQKVNSLTDDAGKGISLYELRHTFVSLCKKEVPEALIKPFIGHSSKMPSYDTYGHYMDGEMDVVAATLDGIFDTILQREGLK